MATESVSVAVGTPTGDLVFTTFDSQLASNLLVYVKTHWDDLLLRLGGRTEALIVFRFESETEEVHLDLPFNLTASVVELMQHAFQNAMQGKAPFDGITFN